jgi:hypothetical protein
MTLELGLLLLESVLLVVTIILLAYSIHEGKQRGSLLREVGRATKVLTRQEYFLTVMEAMQDAKKEIIGCITGRPPSGDDIQMTQNIINTIERMTEKGVSIKYLLPKFPDRVQVGIRYMKAGAEILFSSCLMVHNLRFSVIDESYVVLGIPEETGEKEATKKGYKIPSNQLAVILKDYFNSCDKQISMKTYLQEIVEQTGATSEHLSREFNIDEKDLKPFMQ